MFHRRGEETRFSTVVAPVFIIAAAVVVVIALIGPETTFRAICDPYRNDGVKALIALITNNQTSCFRGVLYDFQTLITGVLAVVAAFVTIQQMRETDLLAERRHRQQLFVAQRSDWLAADKFVAEVTMGMREVLGGYDAIRRLNVSDPTSFHDLKVAYFRLSYGILTALNAIAKTPIELRRLFTIELHSELEMAKAVLDISREEVVGKEIDAASVVDTLSMAFEDLVVMVRPITLNDEVNMFDVAIERWGILEPVLRAWLVDLKEAPV